MSATAFGTNVQAQISGYFTFVPPSPYTSGTSGVAHLALEVLPIGNSSPNLFQDSLPYWIDSVAVDTTTGDSGIRVAQTGITGSRYFTANVRNVAAQAKVVILEGSSGSESASTAPTINHVRGVWGNLIDQIISVTVNSGANLLAGTEIWVWGSD
jgi:hypothetical protein